MEHLIGLERSLLTQQVRGSAQALEALLAPDFTEFGASGRRFSRAGIVADLAGEQPAVYSAWAFECVQLAHGLIQLRYVSEMRSAHGVGRARRSSLWRLEEAGWRMVFHQGTLIPEGGDAG